MQFGGMPIGQMPGGQNHMFDGDILQQVKSGLITDLVQQA